MPIRFSTHAANADKLEADDDSAATPQARTDRARTPNPTEPAAQSERTEAKPGKDINAAGFVKDRDAGQP